jgi:hypothetical protein
MQAYAQYHEGYAQIVGRTPRRMNVDLKLTPMDAAQAAATAGSRVQRPVTVRPTDVVKPSMQFGPAEPAEPTVGDKPTPRPEATTRTERKGPRREKPTKEK